jgi:Fe2+ or Zn2+ uptake regulation protein
MPAEHQTSETSLLERARTACRDRGLKWTSVRGVLCSAADHLAVPFSADALLAEARKVDRAISAATAYRWLAQMEELGLVRTTLASNGQRFYDTTQAAGIGTSHVVCQDCQKVIPLGDPCVGLREGAMARSQGFRATGVSLRVEATCEEFHSKGSCERAARTENPKNQ